MELNEIRERLRQYGDLKREIEFYEEEIKNERETMDSVSIMLDGLPRGTDISDRTGRLAARLADMMNECLERKIEAENRQREIIEIFNEFEPQGIKEHNAKKVLFWRYIKCKSAKETAEELHFDLSYIHALTSKGLERLEEITKNRKK